MRRNDGAHIYPEKDIKLTVPFCQGTVFCTRVGADGIAIKM